MRRRGHWVCHDIIIWFTKEIRVEKNKTQQTNEYDEESYEILDGEISMEWHLVGLRGDTERVITTCRM